MTAPAKGAGPENLARQIYDQALQEAGGDAREASISAMCFLTEALVYLAGMLAGGDEKTRRAALEYVGKMIAIAPVPPIVAAVPAARAARSGEEQAVVPKLNPLDPRDQIAAALGARGVCMWCAPHVRAKAEGRSSDHTRCDDFECGCHCQDRTRVN